MDERLIDNYLGRIGLKAPEAPSLGALRRIQEAHVLAVPFENLGYHLDEEIHMDERAVDKVLRGRGGGCYEINPSLSYLLTALGYDVTLHPGRVHRGPSMGPPFGHIVMEVAVDGERYLVDVGFGRNSRHPLLLTSREEQGDPHGTYQLVEAPDQAGIDVMLNGKPLYRVDLRPGEIGDFTAVLWWWRTCPDSPFLQDVFCSITNPNGRKSLRDRTLTIVKDGEKQVVELESEADVHRAYEEHFGVRLDRLPQAPAPVTTTTGGMRGVQV